MCSVEKSKILREIRNPVGKSDRTGIFWADCEKQFTSPNPDPCPPGEGKDNVVIIFWQ